MRVSLQMSQLQYERTLSSLGNFWAFGYAGGLCLYLAALSATEHGFIMVAR